MEKKFERALLLCPAQYSLSNSLRSILGHMAGEVRYSDIRSAISSRIMKLNSQAFRLPYGVRKRWDRYFLEKVNEMILTQVEEFRPDLVMVYNSLYMVPETCRTVSSRSKLVFFMAFFLQVLGDQFSFCRCRSRLVHSNKQCCKPFHIGT